MNPFKVFVALLAGMLLLPFDSPADEAELLWTLENRFNMPESAAIDPLREVIYVSNVNQYALDGNGFISLVALSGEIINMKWITGINSPTGIAVYQDRLYFADVDALVIADANTGKLLQRIPAPNTEHPAMLNDVAVSNVGQVYVSDSNNSVIYQVEKEKLEVFFADSVILENANGLLVDEQRLIHGGMHWSVFNRNTHSLIDDPGIAVPSGKLYDFDGITHDGRNGFLLTTTNDDRIWQISSQNPDKPFSDLPLKGIDLDYRNGYLAVPRVGGSLSLYRLNHANAEAQ